MSEQIVLNEWGCHPGFRDPDLTNARALQLMGITCREMREAALKRRSFLLGEGFGADHQICVELDEVAARWAAREGYVRRLTAASEAEGL